MPGTFIPVMVVSAFFNHLQLHQMFKNVCSQTICWMEIKCQQYINICLEHIQHVIIYCHMIKRVETGRVCL
jgi:hypothetical protein